MRVYLDNAASTPLDPEVLEKMLPYFTEIQGNPSSVHHHGRQLRSAIEKARKTIADRLGASTGEIFFTSGGTEADNMAIRCTVEGLGITHIVTTTIEHHAVGHCVELMEKEGLAKVTWLRVDSKGNPDLDQLEEILASSPRSFVSLMHGNNEVGTLLNLTKAGEICQKYDAIFHSDTVQSMCNLPYHLSELPVHLVTASGHKFYGPKGVGFLYVKSGLRIPPFILGGGQERNMRAGTENPAAIIGLAFAMEKCYSNLKSKNDHLWGLKKYMRDELVKRIPGVAFNGETERYNSLPTVLNVAFPSESEEPMILFNLDINGISASGGSACTSGSVKGSHVLTGIGCPPERVANSVRFSFGIQNTLEEIEYTLEKLEGLFIKKKTEKLNLQ